METYHKAKAIQDKPVANKTDVKLTKQTFNNAKEHHQQQTMDNHLGSSEEKFKYIEKGKVYKENKEHCWVWLGLSVLIQL